MEGIKFEARCMNRCYFSWRRARNIQILPFLMVPPVFEMCIQFKILFTLLIKSYPVDYTGFEGSIPMKQEVIFF